MEEYSIEMSNKKLKSLLKNIWAYDYAKAKLSVNNQTYSIKIGLRGNQLRKHEKKSFHIIFKDPYFMDGQHEIHLNAEYNDPSLMRNKLSFDFFNTNEVHSPTSNHVLLSINGVIQGIYLKLESFDKYYLRNRDLPDGSIYYATNDDANFSLITPEGNVKKTLLDGYTNKYSVQDDDALKRLIIVTTTFSNEAFCEEITKLLDIEKYFKWLSGAVCTQNFDGFIHNYALYHNSKTQLFEITPWDYDGTWGRNLHGKVLEHDFVPIEGYNTLTGRLLDSPKYKQMYHDILQDILQTSFTTAFQQPRIEKIQSTILPHIEKDPYLRNKREVFISEKDYILNFISQRRMFLMEQLNNSN